MAIRGTLFPLHFTMIGSLYIVLVDKIIAENNDCHYLCLESDSDSECRSKVNLCMQSNIKQTDCLKQKMNGTNVLQ